jgi:hypothetical protein
MSSINLFNKNVSDTINKHDSFYETWFGKEEFVPEVTVVTSADFNCGALCNELEYARLVSDYYVKSLDIGTAEHGELESLINAFIDLPRRGKVESDATFRNRFNFLVVDQVGQRRITRKAILDAIRYFVADVTNSVQLIEPFDSKNLYFQIRIEGSIDTSETITLDNISFGYLDQNYLGGPTLGEINSYLAELIDRIKAAGVDFDMLFVEQNRTTKTCAAFIGAVQIYKSSYARIKAKTSFTKSSNATIV